MHTWPCARFTWPLRNWLCFWSGREFGRSVSYDPTHLHRSSVVTSLSGLQIGISFTLLSCECGLPRLNISEKVSTRTQNVKSGLSVSRAEDLEPDILFRTEILFQRRFEFESRTPMLSPGSRLTESETGDSTLVWSRELQCQWVRNCWLDTRLDSLVQNHACIIWVKCFFRDLQAGCQHLY